MYVIKGTYIDRFNEYVCIDKGIGDSYIVYDIDLATKFMNYFDANTYLIEHDLVDKNWKIIEVV